MTRPLTIIEDPRIQVTTADLQKSFDLAIKVRNKITEISDAFNRIEELQEQIDKRVEQTKDQSYASSLKNATKPVREKLEVVRTELVDWYNHVDQSTLHFPIRLYNMMLTLADQVQSADAAPTKQHGEIFIDLGGKVDVQIRALQQIEASEIAAINKLLIQLGVPPVYVKPAKPKGIA
jgi:flagellar hook-basal body complex protein FliE